MNDQNLIDAYTEKSIAGLKEEHLEKLWEPGDHMYRGEFVSPSRPETYFASDAEVDAYREALARMDGTVDAPPAAPQPTPTPAAHPQEQARPDRNPIVEALSNAVAGSAGSASYRSPEDGDEYRNQFDRHDDDDYDDDDDDDDWKKRKSRNHYDDDDDEKRGYRKHYDDDDD